MEILNFVKNFNKTNTVLLKEDIEENNLIDEITLFVARICRNYDNLPPENQFKAEYNHFIKSMIK